MFSVDLSQVRVLWEERTSAEKMPPTDGPVDRFVWSSLD